MFTFQKVVLYTVCVLMITFILILFKWKIEWKISKQLIAEVFCFQKMFLEEGCMSHRHCALKTKWRKNVAKVLRVCNMIEHYLFSIIMFISEHILAKCKANFWRSYVRYILKLKFFSEVMVSYLIETKILLYKWACN